MSKAHMVRVDMTEYGEPHSVSIMMMFIIIIIIIY